MRQPILSICLPSINYEELVQQLKAIVSLSENCRSEIEILIQFDLGNDIQFTKLSKLAEAANALLLPPANNGVDIAFEALLSNAKGHYVWIVSSNDHLDPGCLDKIIPLLRQKKHALFYLTSRTQNKETTSTSISNDIVLSGLGQVLNMIGTRMSLITSCIFYNTRDPHVAQDYKTFIGTAIAWMTYPCSQLGGKGTAYIFATPCFTNIVHELEEHEVTFYNGYDTFGIAIWDLISVYISPKSDPDAKAFLIKNFGHIWRGGIIDWTRRETPRPIYDIWRLRRYRISGEYWPALFLTAMPKPFVQMALKLYKTMVRNHYS